MVSPADLVYLQPTAPDPATTPADGTSDAGAVAGLGHEAGARDTDGPWSPTKPLLESAAPCRLSAPPAPPPGAAPISPRSTHRAAPPPLGQGQRETERWETVIPV